MRSQYLNDPTLIYLCSINMAQSVEIATLPAMTSPLFSIDPAGVSISELGILSNGATLEAPIYNGSKIILDLTAGEDDWLEIMEANPTVLEHHAGEPTRAMHIAVHLDVASVKQLTDIEKQVQRCKGYSVINSNKAWKGIHRGNGKIILNVVLDWSLALTPLRFVHNGILKKGVGEAFLAECLGESSLTDYQCKVKVELECIHETANDISITLTVHSMILTQMRRRAIVDFTADEEAAAIRAAKRIKYRF